MRLLVEIAVGAVIAFGVWRGLHRGARTFLWAWLPLLLLAGLRAGLLWCGWLDPDSRVSHIFSVLLLGVLLITVFRPRLRKTGQPKIMEAEPRRLSGGEMLDRLLGGILGGCYASFLCLAIAALGSTLMFGVSMNRQACERRQQTPLPPPSPWLNSVKQVCNMVADLNSDGLLCHIPEVGEYSKEMTALVKVLNATPEEQKRIIKKWKLREYIELAEVKGALNDPEYRPLLGKMRHGDLRALKALANHPQTKVLFGCEQIREFAKKVKPSDLLESMAPEPEPLAAAE